MEISKEKMAEFETKFNSLDEKKQWELLINLPQEDKKALMITLDNDSTDVMFIGDKEADFIMYFKDDIGNRAGVNHVLEAMGFNVQDC